MLLHAYLVKTSNGDSFLVSDCINEYDACLMALCEYDDPESIRVVSCVLMPNMPSMIGR